MAGLDPQNPLVISIIGAKDGVGKTLTTILLADALASQGYSVLVADLDFPVRELTVLLHFYKTGDLETVGADKLSVTDVFQAFRDIPDQAETANAARTFAESTAHDPAHNQTPLQSRLPGKKLLAFRYHTFDVLPSVFQVNSAYEEREISAANAKLSLSVLLKETPYLNPQGGYDFVILDCRAGFSPLVAEAHKASRFSLLVQEDDRISRYTAGILGDELRLYCGKYRKPIFKISNKITNPSSSAPSSESEGKAENFADSFILPLDMNLSASEGEDAIFWRYMENSPCKQAMITLWNQISDIMSLNANLENPLPESSDSIRKHESELLDSIRRHDHEQFLITVVISGITTLFILLIWSGKVDLSDIASSIGRITGLPSTYFLLFLLIAPLLPFLIAVISLIWRLLRHSIPAAKETFISWIWKSLKLRRRPLKKTRR